MPMRSMTLNPGLQFDEIELLRWRVYGRAKAEVWSITDVGDRCFAFVWSSDVISDQG